MNCTDNKLGRMLHAWEMGLLSAEEASEFERHLLDCPHCFQQAKEFLEAARLLYHAISLNPGSSSSTEE